MEVWSRKAAGYAILALCSVLIAILLLRLAECLHSPQPFRVALPFSPKPPFLPEQSNFPCLDSESQLRTKKRFAVLHGPDWEIKLVVNPKCLPEHELVFSMEQGRRFLPRPITRHLRFWITKKNDLIYVKGWDSAGSEQLNDTILELVTNHHCKNRRSKDCRVQGLNSLLVRID